MRRGYIGAVIDHNELGISSSIEGDEFTQGEDNCPACARAGEEVPLSRKIIYVEETKRGPKISKNPIIALGLDTNKQYRQCRECGNIYHLKDLPTTIMQYPDKEQEDINRAYLQGDYIPGPGPDHIKKKARNASKLKSARKNLAELTQDPITDKPKPKGKIISKQIQRTKVKIIKKIPENV